MKIKLVILAGAIAASASTSASDVGVTHVVKVENIAVVNVGMISSIPSSYGIVNRKGDACYCVAPPWGARLVVGDKYLLKDADIIDDVVRREIKALYKNCRTVQAIENLSWPNDAINKSIR